MSDAMDPRHMDPQRYEQEQELRRIHLERVMEAAKSGTPPPPRELPGLFQPLDEPYVPRFDVTASPVVREPNFDVRRGPVMLEPGKFSSDEEAEDWRRKDDMARKASKERRDLKPTNPKDLIGISKIAMSVLPLGVIMETALALMEGARKYGRHNYRAEGVLASVYFDAACRHLFAWWEGEDLDPDSGVSHITKAMACLIVLRDSMRVGNWRDDRPVVTEKEGWIKELNKVVQTIFEKYPDCGNHHTNK